MKSCSFSTGWIASLFALLVTAHTSYGQTDSLVLASGTAAANGTVSLNLTLTSPPGSEPAAIQWTLTFPPANVASISAVAGTSPTNAGKTISCNPGTGAYTCLISGMNANIISNGVVAVVNVTMAAGVTSTTIGLSNTLGASVSGSSTTISATGGVVTGGAPATPAPTPTLTSVTCLQTSLISLAI